MRLITAFRKRGSLLVRCLALMIAASITPGVSGDDSPRRAGDRQTPSIELEISELMYHPQEGGAEFIELANLGDRTLDLSGIEFVDGISFSFPSGTVLQAGARLVLASSSDEFNAAYAGVDLAGVYTGRLSNGGEKVELETASGWSLATIRYDDDVPWPTGTDGLGYSMVLSATATDREDPYSWCQSSSIGGSPGEAEPSPCPARTDPTDQLFEDERILDIRIEIDPQDWDELRFQEREIFDLLFGEDCLDQPFGTPFTYFPGDVTVDGVTLTNVGVRKKGFLGSLNRDRPSLKIKADTYVTGQRLSGLRRMTLNNANQDPAYINQCLGYRLFDAAGIPAPRCSFATVAVNGADLGLYVHVESVHERFLARHFKRNDGTLFEGTLSDFRDGWMNTFDQKTNGSEDDLSDLEAVTDALATADEVLENELRAIIDLDEFMTFWAMEVLVGHWDGYSGNTNNFFVYSDPESDRLHFIPWGIDALFDSGEAEAAQSVLAASALARRLYQYEPTRDLYVERLLELLDSVWHEDEILSDINQMTALIRPFIIDEQLEFFDLATERVNDFVSSRRADVLAALVPTPPDWDEALRDPICFTPIGELSATFETTWGTFNTVEPFVAGTSDIELSIEEQVIDIFAGGASAGLNEGGDRLAVIALFGALFDGTIVAAVFETDPSLIATGNTLTLDMVTTVGYLITLDPATGFEPEMVGLIADGELHLDEASTESDATIRGSVAGLLYLAPF